MAQLSKILKYVTDPDYRFIIDSNKGKYDAMPDNEYLKRRFKATLGYDLNLDNPQTFNEKIQWLKLYDRKPIYTSMVDKFEAKEYVSKIIGSEYIIPTYGIWDSFEDINFESLPNQFVLKCTHDSGGLVIVRDKANFDLKSAKKKVEKSLARNYFNRSREWPYKNVKPRIIVEKYMDDGHDGLRDYKFFNYNGKGMYVYVSEGLENHSTAKISFYDLEGKQMPFRRLDYKGFDDRIEFPENFSKMKGVSEKLAQAINSPFVRTDFYSINGLIYFSEITFSPCSGMIPFFPSEWDMKLGELLELPGGG